MRAPPSRRAVPAVCAAAAAAALSAGCSESKDEPSAADRPVTASSDSSGTAERRSSEQPPAELEQSVPKGRYYWRGRPSKFTRRDGGTGQITAMEGRWSFGPPECSAKLCTCVFSGRAVVDQ